MIEQFAERRPTVHEWNEFERRIKALESQLSAQQPEKKMTLADFFTEKLTGYYDRCGCGVSGCTSCNHNNDRRRALSQNGMDAIENALRAAMEWKVGSITHQKLQQALDALPAELKELLR